MQWRQNTKLYQQDLFFYFILMKDWQVSALSPEENPHAGSRLTRILPDIRDVAVTTPPQKNTKHRSFSSQRIQVSAFHSEGTKASKWDELSVSWHALFSSQKRVNSVLQEVGGEMKQKRWMMAAGSEWSGWGQTAVAVQAFRYLAWCLMWSFMKE